MIPQALVASLLATVAQYTGYAIPGTPPEIEQISHAALEATYCHRPCKILGLTTPEGVILLDDRLAIGKDAAATSILVHELAHFLQRANASSGTTVNCQVWAERESEAYDVQYRWLREKSPSILAFSQSLSELGLHQMIPRCAEDSGSLGGDRRPASPQPDRVML
ncbi:hypothetical protein ACFPL7_04475 [Dongia soli]|uniref:IrrE N-terminal-like domain-containing protein n=1 Tax=Dongia soli TaxID=600628 RepID=A0ABU5EHX6_9PROT|nr:hypothetical protein [Dongia soli]MDY0885806.1 hypothetical protein [Dongia soli]